MKKTTLLLLAIFCFIGLHAQFDSIPKKYNTTIKFKPIYGLDTLTGFQAMSTNVNSQTGFFARNGSDSLLLYLTQDGYAQLWNSNDTILLDGNVITNNPFQINSTSDTLFRLYDGARGDVSYITKNGLNVSNSFSYLSGDSICFWGDSYVNDILLDYPKYVLYYTGMLGISYGVSGDRLVDQVADLDNLLASEPFRLRNYTHLILNIGINDHVNNYPLGDITDTVNEPTFCGKLKYFIETSLGSNHKLRIFCVTPNEFTWSGNYKKRNTAGYTKEELGVKMQEICSYYSIPVIDLYSQVGINEISIDSLSYDNVHPNSNGQKIIGRIISGALFTNSGQVKQLSSWNNEMVIGAWQFNDSLHINGNNKDTLLSVYNEDTCILHLNKTGQLFIRNHKYYDDERNTIDGYLAGNNLSGSTQNTMLGYKAGLSVSTGMGGGIFIGARSGENTTTGVFNTFVGWKSGFNNITGDNNTYLGLQSGYFSTGDENVALGMNSCYSGLSGNSCVGYGTMYSGSGSYNSIFGYEAGYNSDGDYNVFLGYQAGYNETGSNKLYIENSNSSSPLIYGDMSTDSLSVNATLSVNSTSDTLFRLYDGAGGEVFRVNKNGSFFAENYKFYDSDGNTADGYNSLISLTTGSKNTCVGYNTGSEITNYNYNTCIGYNALRQSNSIGTVMIGYQCGNGISASANYSIGIGYQAMNLANGSTESIAIGLQAGYGNSGSRNILLGYQAGYTGDGDYNVFIGNQAGYNETGSNKLYIENSNSSSPLIYGEFDNDYLKFNADSAEFTSWVKADSFITIGGETYADYVFKPDYKLLPFKDQVSFYRKNSYLPSLKTTGKYVNLQARQEGIVEELEKLYIYTENIYNENDSLKNEIIELKLIINELKKQITEIKESIQIKTN